MCGISAVKENAGGEDSSTVKVWPFSLHFTRSAVLQQHKFCKLSQEVQTLRGLLKDIASHSYKQTHYVPEGLWCIVCVCGYLYYRCCYIIAVVEKVGSD